MADVTLDLRGLHCPLPILRAKKALREMRPGAELEALADDPLSPVDFAAYCEQSGDALIESVAIDAAFRFRIRRSGERPSKPVPPR